MKHNHSYIQGENQIGPNLKTLSSSNKQSDEESIESLCLLQNLEYIARNLDKSLQTSTLEFLGSEENETTQEKIGTSEIEENEEIGTILENKNQGLEVSNTQENNIIILKIGLGWSQQDSFHMREGCLIRNLTLLLL